MSFGVNLPSLNKSFDSWTSVNDKSMKIFLRLVKD